MLYRSILKQSQEQSRLRTSGTPLKAIFYHSLWAMTQTRTGDRVTVNSSVLANSKHGETCGLI